MSIWLIVVLVINSLILSVIALGVAIMACMEIQENRRAKNGKPPRIYCCRCDEEIKEEMEEVEDELNCGACCAVDSDEQVELVKVSRAFQCL